MKEKIIKIGKNYIRTQRGRWIYEERGLYVDNIIKQLALAKELPVGNISFKHKNSGTKNLKVEKYYGN